MKKSKKLLGLMMVAALMMMMVACGKETPTESIYENVAASEPTPAKDVVESEPLVEAEKVEEAPLLGSELLLATTTSTRDSGLLDAILDDFTKQTGIEVKVIAVGTGKALQMGRDGEADALLVHAKSSEEAFVAEGYGTERLDVMYNDFVIVGPIDDPAGLIEGAASDVVAGLALIDASSSRFLSRGDDSGTNKKEISLWDSAGILADGKDYYVSTGKGMGDTLTMTSEMQAYTMTDRATYLNMEGNLDLEISLEGDPLMFNQYGVIPVNPELNDLINHNEALVFVEWLLSEETQSLIGQYGVERFGSPLFTPNAK